MKLLVRESSLAVKLSDFYFMEGLWEKYWYSCSLPWEQQSNHL